MPKVRITRSMTAGDRGVADGRVPHSQHAPSDPPAPRTAAKSDKHKLEALRLELAVLEERIGANRVRVETRPPRGLQRNPTKLPDPLGIGILLKILGGPTVATKHEVMSFLRSGGVVPQVSIWSKQYDLSSESKLREGLARPFPLLPWSDTAESDLAEHIARLAGLGTREAQEQESSAVICCCVTFCKTLRKKNQESFFDSFQLSNHSTFLFCAALLLVVYRDYAANAKNGFFATLLRSVLVKPMSDQLRGRWEELYEIPAATGQEVTVELERKSRLWIEVRNKLDAETGDQGSRMEPMRPETAHEVLKYIPGVDFSPFTPIEEHLYLEAFLAYKENKKTEKTRLNVGFISEVMPRRSAVECIQHHYARKSRNTQLTLSTGDKRPASAVSQDETPQEKYRKFEHDQYSRNGSSPVDSAIAFADSGFDKEMVPLSELIEAEKRYNVLLAEQDDALRREEHIRKCMASKLSERDVELSNLQAAKELHQQQLADKERLFQQEKKLCQNLSAQLSKKAAAHVHLTKNHREQLAEIDLQMKAKQSACNHLAGELSKKSAKIEELQVSYGAMARKMHQAMDESTHTSQNHLKVVAKKDAELKSTASAKRTAEMTLEELRRKLRIANERANRATKEAEVQAEGQKEQAKGKDQAEEELASTKRAMAAAESAHKTALAMEENGIGPAFRRRDRRIKQLEDELKLRDIPVPQALRR